MTQPASTDPIRVGILHSMTGPMAASEAPLVEAALMAVDEINQAGGVLGRPLLPLIGDGASDPGEFAAAAQRLLSLDQVATIFGGWTSMSRKAVLPALEAHNCLLWYPVHYEGLEQSPWVFYTGSCLNQQVEPALDWLLAQGHRRLFLLGSDHLFPRVTNKVVKGQLKRRQGTVVAEAYVPLGATDFSDLGQTILAAQPDAIFSTLNGLSNVPFYKQCQALGLSPDRIPILTVSIGELELRQIGAAAAGHYACWSYFQSLETAANQSFVARFKQRYGSDRVTTDSIEAAYTQVYLWRAAATAAQTVATDPVRQATYHQRWQAPSGTVYCELNHHLQKRCHVGQAQANGQFRIVYSSPGPIRPLPWLGMENQTFPAAMVVTEMLGEVSACVQSSWELEQQSRRLEQALAQLRQEVAQRQQAEAALRAANAEITNLNQTLQADNSRMSAELSVARQIQRMVLPRSAELEAVVDLDVAGFMAAATEVGGDYYDVLQGDVLPGDETNRSVTLAIGDVTGHGLESGVLMIMAQTAVRTLQALGANQAGIGSAQAFQAINTVLYQNRLRMGSQRHLSLALINYHRGTLTISGQHEEIIVVRSGTAQRIDTVDLGYPVGLVANIAPFVAQHRLSLAVGDGVVLYSDGITEAENSQRDLYGIDRLVAAVQRAWGGAAQEIQAAVIDDVRSHVQDHAICDDMTLVVLKRRV
ncbi:transporter substrate-binding protein [Nodosilinea sp. LEGE 06152]|uniref:transporter substrate-binding protein n=1 Tax=Nodosilinea sp. LEGE 06152 TaxID=2777966 RepID=UPI00187F864C|nr:transporter substrate-binding protein [Nodosilinea sp. LEGE 06152]MBE9156586.1 transporter substrate-binding protein [Nodosilinea sp. LEGE 06152]